MNCCKDCVILQNDIDYLVRWCNSTEMKFHPDKCKVLSVKTKSCNSKLTYLSELPQSRFNYTLGNEVLDYETNEKDLGIIVNTSFSWGINVIK